MASLISSLLYKSADTLHTWSSQRSTTKSPNMTKDDSSWRLQTSGLLSSSSSSDQIHSAPVVPDRVQATTSLYDTPPPYDPTAQHNRSSYTQFVDKLRDSTSKLAYSQQQVNRKGVLQGIKLVEIAVDEYDSGNEAIALDVYLSGLDKIIMALPNLKDIKTKDALQEKFISLQDRVGIAAMIQQQRQQQQQQEDNNNTADIKSTDRISTSSTNPPPAEPDSLISVLSNFLAPAWLTAAINQNTGTNKEGDQPVRQQEASDCVGDSLLQFKWLGRTMTDLIVKCVVYFKQTPFPGFLAFSFSCFVHLVFWFDHHFQVVEKLHNLGITCIKKLLAADEKYRLHEFASEALYTLISASLKAIVAYKEAPSYQQQASPKTSAATAAWIWSRPLLSTPNIS